MDLEASILFLSMYITYISVSISAPLAVTGPPWAAGESYIFQVINYGESPKKSWGAEDVHHSISKYSFVAVLFGTVQ